MRQRGHLLALAMGALFVASACGNHAASRPQTVTVTEATAAEPAAATDSASALTTAATNQRPARVRKIAHWRWGFQSPTGNIRCAIDAADAEMLDCRTLNNGRGVVLDSLVAAYEDGTVRVPAQRTLDYGWRWVRGAFLCWSRETGVECRSKYSRHGFSINRDGIDYWRWNRPLQRYGGSGSYGGGNTYSGGTIAGGNGYPVMCADGTMSNSGGIQGACSWHGGEAGP